MELILRDPVKYATLQSQCLHLISQELASTDTLMHRRTWEEVRDHIPGNTLVVAGAGKMNAYVLYAMFELAGPIHKVCYGMMGAGAGAAEVGKKREMKK